MIVLISPENELPQELELLHQLFDAGLEHYHLRKPQFEEKAYQGYLKQIAPQYLDRVMLHNHHLLASAFSVKGIHLEEARWREKEKEKELTNFVTTFQEKGNLVSSSYHEPEDLERQKVAFDYYMLSPVFGAISKSGYEGRGFNVTKSRKKIVGMGGINAQTTPKALKLGFAGVGTLGGIWNAENPVTAFKEIKRAFLGFKALK